MGEAGFDGLRRARTGLGWPLRAAALAGLLMLVGACGSSGQPQQSAPSSSSAPSSGPAVSTVSTVATAGSLSVSGSVPPVPDGSPTTLRGTVTEGVENNCVVLVDDTGAAVANLQGWDLGAHPFNSEVEVTGTFEPDLMTTCQQGTPFEATAVVSR